MKVKSVVATVPACKVKINGLLPRIDHVWQLHAN